VSFRDQIPFTETQLGGPYSLLCRWWTLWQPLSRLHDPKTSCAPWRSMRTGGRRRWDLCWSVVAACALRSCTLNSPSVSRLVVHQAGASSHASTGHGQWGGKHGRSGLEASPREHGRHDGASDSHQPHGEGEAWCGVLAAPAARGTRRCRHTPHSILVESGADDAPAKI